MRCFLRKRIRAFNWWFKQFIWRPFVQCVKQPSILRYERMLNKELAMWLYIPEELAATLGKDSTGKAYLKMRSKLVAAGEIVHTPMGVRSRGPDNSYIGEKCNATRR